MDTVTPAEKWPRISVIIPSYNQGVFIRQTIDSVMAQGYPNLELIVIDGGSQDGTRAILREYGSDLAYWISEPDNGQSHAINKGLAVATGSLVGWLNSDDLYLPGFLFQSASHFAANPGCDVVFGDYVFIDSSGIVLKHRRETPFDFNTYLWARGCFHANCAGMFQHRVFTEVGGLREDLQFAMDYEFYLRIGSRGLRVDHVSECWGAYRLHLGSKTVASNESQVREMDTVAAMYAPDASSAWLRGPFHSAKRRLRKLATGCYRPWERIGLWANAHRIEVTPGG